MCGRFAVTLPPQAMAQLFGSNDLPNFGPNFNITPTSQIPMIAVGKAGDNRIIMARWGLMPQWMQKDPQTGPLFNARAETIFEKPSFAKAVQKHRCLIPADGYYEWVKEDDGKQPFFIHKNDNTPMAFGGIWEMKKQDDEILISCSIITNEAEGEMKQLHNRTPLIMPKSEWQNWINPHTETEIVKKLLFNNDIKDIAFHKVSKRVNSIKSNDADLLKAI